VGGKGCASGAVAELMASLPPDSALDLAADFAFRLASNFPPAAAPPFAPKCAKYARICKISSAKRTEENELLGIEWRQFAGLSLVGTSAVRFQGGR